MTRSEKYSIPIPTEGAFNSSSAYEYIRTLNPKSRELLNLLIWYKAKHTFVCPRQDTLAKHLGISRMQVSRIIKKLVEDGVIGKVYRHQKSCYYNLNFLLFTHAEREKISSFLTNLFYLKHENKFTTVKKVAHSKVPYVGLFLALSKVDVTQTILKDTPYDSLFINTHHKHNKSKLNARARIVKKSSRSKILPERVKRVRRRNITMESLGNVLMDIGLRVYSILGNSSDALMCFVGDLKKMSEREKKPSATINDRVQSTSQTPPRLRPMANGMSLSSSKDASHLNPFSPEAMEEAKRRVFNTVPDGIRRSSDRDGGFGRLTLDRVDISQFSREEIEAAKRKVMGEIPSDWRRTHLILQQLGFED